MLRCYNVNRPLFIYFEYSKRNVSIYRLLCLHSRGSWKNTAPDFLKIKQCARHWRGVWRRLATPVRYGIKPGQWRLLSHQELDRRRNVSKTSFSKTKRVEKRPEKPSSKRFCLIPEKCTMHSLLVLLFVAFLSGGKACLISMNFYCILESARF